MGSCAPFLSQRPGWAFAWSYVVIKKNWETKVWSWGHRAAAEPSTLKPQIREVRARKAKRWGQERMKPSPHLYSKVPRPHSEPTLLWTCINVASNLSSGVIPNSLAPDPGCLRVIPETLQGTEWRLSWKKPWHPAFLLPLGHEKDLGQEPMSCTRKREVMGTEGSQF